MRLRDLIPLLALAALATVAWIAFTSESAFNFAFQHPPQFEPIESAEPPVGEAVFEGTILGKDDLPLRNAQIALIVRGRIFWSYSDGSGRFRIAEVDPGPVRVWVLALGYRPAEIESVAGEGPVELALELLPDPPILEGVERTDVEGTVLLPQVGASAEGYEVAFLPTAPPDALGLPGKPGDPEGTPGVATPRRIRVGADGAFRVAGLAHGMYDVIVLPPWAAGGTWPDLLADLDTGPARRLVHEGSGLRAPLELSVRAGEIAGSLPDRSLGVGAEVTFIDGASVIVSPASDADSAVRAPRVWPAQRTDVRGRFLFRDLPPGRYLVQIAAGDTRIQRIVQVRERSTVDLDL